MSWLFVLIQQLRQFIIPIIVLFAFGRGDRNDLWGLVAIIAGVGITIGIAAGLLGRRRSGSGPDRPEPG